jgi:hypothetical protein
MTGATAYIGQDRGGHMDPTLDEIITFLNNSRVRATYGAVAEILGVVPRSMGARLGSHHVEASWIVSAATGLPTGYSPTEIHPELRTSSPLIRTGDDLRERMQRR